MTDWLAARNILAVRLDNIGDVIMLGVALRAVKAVSPEARITLLASPAGVQAAPLLPWIDDTIEWRPVWQDVGGRMPFDPGRERELISLLEERAFDAALIFTSFSQSPHPPAYVCYLAGIPLRAGESKEFGGSVLTQELRGASDDLHQVDRNLRLVQSLGFHGTGTNMQVAVSPEDRQGALQALSAARISQDRPTVVIHPGASAAARRYPAAGYAAAARMLSESGWQVVVTGTARESGIVQDVMRGAPDAVMMVGNMSLQQYAALIESAAAVVCGNTLPLHLADAVGTPVVSLYSGTDLESQWRPRHTPHTLLRRDTVCYPCYRFECPIGQPCLAIPPAEIAAAVLELYPEREAAAARRWEAAYD